MLTVRVSPTEVQFDAMVYTFADADTADRFFMADTRGGAQAILYELHAIRSRPIDCDHELGSFPE